MDMTDSQITSRDVTITRLERLIELRDRRIASQKNAINNLLETVKCLEDELGYRY